MEPNPSLEDAIYRASVLGPDRAGTRRALSLGLSGACFLGLGTLTLALAPRDAAPAPIRAVATLTLDFTETLPPPPPPPAGPLTAAAPASAMAIPAPLDTVPATPDTLPDAPLPSTLPTPAAAAGPGSGAPGGQAGGVAGGQAGGIAGGLVGSQGPAVQAPRFDAAYLRNPEPDYPTLSRRLREEGRVVLRVRVSEAGLPDRIELSQTSGHPRLDQAALEAVRRWRFQPARRGAESLAAWVLVPLSFSLEA